jgi:hypothetical protein
MARNGGWSGKADFKYEIERYKRVSDGMLFTVDAPEVVAAGDLSEDTAEWTYALIEVKCSGSVFFSPGRMYGPPEDCYPDEGDLELEEVTGPDGKDWLDLLTKGERQNIESQLAEECHEGDEPDPDDAYDSRFDQQDGDAYDYI